ncbi:MAG: helix-hairpin-helix domain-containing protein [Chromatiaceae bacterium]
MDGGQRFSLVVDDREPSGAVLKALHACECFELRVERLAVGDYLVDDHLLFERKTLPDLLASIKDGRLFAQALRLAAAPLRGALILEGRSQDVAGSRMRREAIQGALVTLSLFIGIPVLRSMGPQETACLIRYAAHQDRAYAAGALARKGRRPRGKVRVQSHILQGLPGVGPERARRLLDRFGSVQAVISAPADTLASVPGVGKETAQAIRWAVRETRGPYGNATDRDDGWAI